MLFHKSTSFYRPVISNSNPKNPTDIHVQVVGGEIATLANLGCLGCDACGRGVTPSCDTA